MAMKSFNHNFIEPNILLNALIYYSFDEKLAPIYVKIPTIEDSLNDPGFNVFLSFMFLKLNDYKKLSLILKIENEGEGFIAIIRESKEVREQIKPYIEKYLVGSTVSIKGITIEDRVLTAEEVNFFRKIILVSFGAESIDGIDQEEKEKEMIENMSAAEKAIYLKQQDTLKRLAEAKKKKQQGQSQDGQIDLSKIIIGVMKEFNLSLEEIKKLNYYTLYYLFGYVFKIDHYDFMKKAAASGNLTKKAKIKHWLE